MGNKLGVQTAISPLNARHRYPPMPGHFWQPGQAPYELVCPKCGAARRSNTNPSAAYAPKQCNACRIQGARRQLSLILKRPARTR